MAWNPVNISQLAVKAQNLAWIHDISTGVSTASETTLLYFANLLWPLMFQKNYFTSSDPHRDIILYHIMRYLTQILTFFALKSGENEKERIILMKSKGSRFHQNYPLLLVPSPGWGSSSDHCDLSGQTDSNWLSLCLIRNNFRRLGVSRRLGAWELRFEWYKTVRLS